MGYRHGHRSTWLKKLTPRERCLVEHIATKYDASWRIGWLSEDGLWKNPYCEGMIEAAAWLGDGLDEWTVRRCVAEYCCANGYMPMAGQRPEWLEEHMDFVNNLWAREDAEKFGSENPLVASRKKLQLYLRDLGFSIQAGPNATKQWVLVNENTLVDGKPQTVYIEVFAHKDGRQANYALCNEKWNRVL